MRAAKEIAEELGDAEMISMRLDPQKVSAEDVDVVGFLFPVYH